MTLPIPSGFARLLPSVFDRMHEGIVVTDADLDAPGPSVVYANPAFTRITGYSADEIIGHSPRMLQGPASDRTVLDRLGRQLRAGESFEGETMNYRKDGTPFVMQWYVEPLHDDDGVITHYVAVQRDVTHERETTRQQRALVQAIGQLADFAVLFGVDGTVRYANRAYFQWCGLPRDAVLGERIWALPGTPGRHALAWARRVLEQGTAWRQQYQTHRRNGRRTLFVTVSPISDEAGIQEFLVVGRDVTDAPVDARLAH
ncbi:MAG: PAS domain-containing protein [Acidobacteriota bacterium]